MQINDILAQMGGLQWGLLVFSAISDGTQS